MPRVHGIDKQRRRAPGGGIANNNTNNTNSSLAGMFSLSTPFANFAGRAITTTAGVAQGGATPNCAAYNPNNMMASDELSFCTSTQPSQDLLSTTTTNNNRNNNSNNDTAQQQEEEEEEVMGTQNPNFPTARGAVDVEIMNRPTIQQQHFDNGNNDSNRSGIDRDVGGGVDRGGAMTAMKIIPQQTSNESNAPSLLAETKTSITTVAAETTTTATKTAAGRAKTFPKLAGVPSSNKLATSGIKLGITTTTTANAANAALSSNSN
ncbi:hypothetical protein ACHAWC_004679, partial [Mediolabrus comicus]